jgi:hypothetical protein
MPVRCHGKIKYEKKVFLFYWALQAHRYFYPFYKPSLSTPITCDAHNLRIFHRKMQQGTDEK